MRKPVAPCSATRFAVNSDVCCQLIFREWGRTLPASKGEDPFMITSTEAKRPVGTRSVGLAEFSCEDMRRPIDKWMKAATAGDRTKKRGPWLMRCDPPLYLFFTEETFVQQKGVWASKVGFHDSGVQYRRANCVMVEEDKKVSVVVPTMSKACTEIAQLRTFLDHDLTVLAMDAKGQGVIMDEMELTIFYDDIHQQPRSFVLEKVQRTWHMTHVDPRPMYMYQACAYNSTPDPVTLLAIGLETYTEGMSRSSFYGRYNSDYYSKQDGGTEGEEEDEYYEDEPMTP